MRKTLAKKLEQVLADGKLSMLTGDQYMGLYYGYPKDKDDERAAKEAGEEHWGYLFSFYGGSTIAQRGNDINLFVSNIYHIITTCA